MTAYTLHLCAYHYTAQALRGTQTATACVLSRTLLYFLHAICRCNLPLDTQLECGKIAHILVAAGRGPFQQRSP